MTTPIHDLYKSADVIMSDSAFDTLALVERLIAEADAQLAELKADAKLLKWGSFESSYNWEGQREAHGQLLALATLKGHLGAVTTFKRTIADAKRAGEPSQEVA